MNHIGECCGKMAEYLGYVRNLPVNSVASDISYTSSFGLGPIWIVCMTIRAEGDPATVKANLGIPELC